MILSMKILILKLKLSLINKYYIPELGLDNTTIF